MPILKFLKRWSWNAAYSLALAAWATAASGHARTSLALIIASLPFLFTAPIPAPEDPPNG